MTRVPGVISLSLFRSFSRSSRSLSPISLVYRYKYIIASMNTRAYIYIYMRSVPRERASTREQTCVRAIHASIRYFRIGGNLLTYTCLKFGDCTSN